ncbi:ComEC/Rec2 family competence protein [Marinomonas transparens]|uniref:ComEC/Rec2 family competence protein n=1 Tax=Marinomonas transparens TaxID=2795388 RepID=A0A934JVU2_9GAMM|nr:ComEC/Rec2 family competence protein [Marinomonas transparens]MBJ7538144.1 ComEC/Rec2 family competence protein [Marinomonas transparens]
MLLSSLSILMGAVLVPSEYLWLYSTHIILVCLYLIVSKRLIVLILTVFSLLSVYCNEFHQEAFSLPLIVGQRVSFNPESRIMTLAPRSAPLAGGGGAWEEINKEQQITIHFFNSLGDREVIRDVSLSVSELGAASSMIGEITQITLPDKNGLWWQRQLYIERQVVQLGLKFFDPAAITRQQHSIAALAIRERFVRILDDYFDSFASWRFSKALLLGSNDLWSERDVWMVRTLGLAHLFVVSGLHVGFVFVLGCLLSRFLWRMMPKSLLLAGLARWHMDAIVVIPILLLYCYITNWGEPVVRASIMLTTYLLARVCSMKVSAYAVITFALWLVLLVDPRAILDAGLWLSFSMVYLLIGFFQTSIHWTRLFAVQLMLSTASMVLVLGWQEAISSASILVNLLLVPITGFIWFPWGVLACVEGLITGTTYGYAVLDVLLNCLLSLVEFLAFTAPLFFFEQFDSSIPRLIMLILLIYWVFQTPLRRGVFAVCGIWLALFSVTPLSFNSPDLMLENQRGELVLKGEQGILLSAQWAGKERGKLSLDAYIKSHSNETLSLSAEKGGDWSPRELLQHHVDWLFLQGTAASKTVTRLNALQVNWLILSPDEWLAFYFRDDRILLRHSGCIFSFFLFKSDTCKHVEKLENMLN